MNQGQSIFQVPWSGSLEYNISIAPPGQASGNTTGLKTQLAISILLGTGSFLAFCYLRTRWTILFAPRTKLKRHTPPSLSHSFFGWIPQLLRIPESEILDCVGLDAAMMLRILIMCLKLFTACLIPGVLIIWPINYLSTTEDGRLPDTGDDDEDYDLSVLVPHRGMSLLYLFTQFTFTWIFSLFTIYLLWRTYEGYIEIRRSYIMKRRKAIVNRSIMVTGLPLHLQTDRSLATFYESLGVGAVESAHVGRHVASLQRLIEQRAHALKCLEAVYTSYYGNPSSRPDYDPESIIAENDHYQPTAAGEDIREDYFSDTSSRSSSETKYRKRPTMKLGFLGLFGKKVDKIDYYREVFATLDKAVQKLRMSRVFASTGIGFITFEEMNSAQILAQTVNTQETLSCETFLAPEPRDVYWDNLDLPSTELEVRTIVINAVVFFLVFFSAVPVSVFSSFLNLESLNKIFPGISKLAAKNRLIKSLIQGFLPTVGVIVFLTFVPRILYELCRLQGIRSHSEIARSLYHKYFTFVLCNVFLAFTIVGTWAQTVNKVYHNAGELTLLLAMSLPRVAPFFVNYIILRGIGLFPLQLLQTANFFGLIVQRFTAKTPRDYAEARAPPELPYGVVYANTTLIFVIVLIYSCMRPLILIFGVIYFALAYFVYKYQILYVYFHPNESSGQTWPMVYSRMTFGLIIFQLTMLGFFMLKHAYIFGILLAPLPALTIYFWRWTTETYKWTAQFMPLELMRPTGTGKKPTIYDDAGNNITCTNDNNNINNNNNSNNGNGSSNGNGTYGSSTAIQSRYHNNTYNSLETLGSLSSDISGADSGLGQFNTLDVSRAGGKTLRRSASIIVSGATIMTTPADSKRRFSKIPLDEDDYQAIPDRFTDFQQPPMTLFPGVLNSGLRRYCHPALSGPLPTLWLPLTKEELADIPIEEINYPDDGPQNIDSADHRSRLATIVRVGDEPQSYDQSDNLVGGGQDEDLDQSPRLDCSSGDADGAGIQVSDTTLVPGAQDVLTESESESESDNDDTKHRRPSMVFPTEEEQIQIPASPSVSKKNPAVDGITHVYYHHPERRSSKAGSTSALRPPSSLQTRGSRTSLLRDRSQSISTSPPPLSAPISRN